MTKTVPLEDDVHEALKFVADLDDESIRGKADELLRDELDIDDLLEKKEKLTGRR